MFLTHLNVISMVLAAPALAAGILSPRACGETAQPLCYGGPSGGTAQDVDPSDVEYVAGYIRYTGAGKFWTMPSGFDCEEWAIEVPGAATALALAKHINPRLTSSVLIDDIANTIDGGVDASDEEKEDSLLGCGKGGGQRGVKVDSENEAYTTEEYKAGGGSPEGILIKIVRDPAFGAK